MTGTAKTRPGDDPPNLAGPFPGVAAYAAAVAARTPAPGGGGVVGVAAALAAALGAMVCRFTIPVTADGSEPSTLDAVLDELDRLRAEMLDLANADAAAYGSYQAAAGLPKRTDQERERRRAAMQAALIQSTEVPLAVARGSGRIRTLLQQVAEAGNPYLRSDATIGALLSEAAVRGSLINVRGNVALLNDQTIAERYRNEADGLERGLDTRTHDG